MPENKEIIDLNMDDSTEMIDVAIEDAEKLAEKSKIETEVAVAEEKIYDDYYGDKITLIPTPNFTDCKSVGSSLPINMVSETVNNISRIKNEKDLVAYVRDELKYDSRLAVCQSFSSEQVDAICLSIRQFKKNNAFILGDMAGIGKGRICAALLRYAYINNLVPIFITEKPYLFSDIYRDIMDIGGFGSKAGKVIEAIPLIFNHRAKVEASIRKKRVAKPLFEPPTEKVLIDIYKDGQLPKTATKYGLKYNCVFLTYDQISKTKISKSIGKNYKVELINKLAPNSIVIFDESHNAASADSSSNILQKIMPIVENCNSCLFSSATYAKNPQVFQLYVVRTALRSAVPSLELIANALKVGGENVSEYIASGLAKEGQMIRRERDYSDCNTPTSYVEGDSQLLLYNTAVEYFKEIRDLTTTDDYKNGAKNAALQRLVTLNKDILRDSEVKYYISLKNQRSTDTNIRDDKSRFIRENFGRYMMKVKTDSISRYRFSYIETLFYAVKAKYTVQKVLECLNTPVNYKNSDGLEYNAPMKPLISARLTQENLFQLLDLDINDEIDNNFSDFLKAIYRKIFFGKVVITKIDYNIFKSEDELEEEGKKLVEEQYEFEINLNDFSQEAITQILELQSRLDGYRTELPLSVIDYIKHHIEEVTRPNFYSNLNLPSVNTSNYTFNELTGRKLMLKWNGSKYVLKSNDKIKSTTLAFESFNNGAIDVILLNVAASTGGSAHSSPSEGLDTRPRNMFVIQFELDVNKEVQKRGRVNRTGQLNLPTYTYIISRIPSEIRKYLMFRKKLRKLDANVSANQTQSGKAADIKDKQGNPIQDLFNYYGYEVFKNFIYDPNNRDYYLIYSSITSSNVSSSEQSTYEQKQVSVKEFEDFSRELELYNCNIQLVFYDEMNRLFTDYISSLKALKTYQEELDTVNYKASLKQRVVIQINNGNTIFSMPLFEEINFVLQENRAFSKQYLEQKISDLANKKEPSVFYQELKDDFRNKFNEYFQELISEFVQNNTIERTTSQTDEEYQDVLDRFQVRKGAYETRLRELRNEVQKYIEYFFIGRAVSYQGNLGKFVGYKIHRGVARFPYSAGSVEFVFCFLNSFPILQLKISSNKSILDEIMMESSTMFPAFAMNRNMPKDIIRNYEKVNNWEPDRDKRVLKIFLSGNILSAVVEAQSRLEATKIQEYKLVRYTNLDGSVSTSVEQNYGNLPDSFRINVERSNLKITLDNSRILDYLELLPYFDFDNRLRPDERRGLAIWEENERFFIIKKQGVVDSILINFVGQIGKGKDTPNSFKRFYNPIYDDVDIFENRFKDFYFGERRYRIDYDPFKDYGILTSYFKNLEFPNTTNGRNKLMECLTYIYDKYGCSILLKSSVEGYYNIEQEEMYVAGVSSSQSQDLFPKGDYKYSFTRFISSDDAKKIPKFKSYDLFGRYNGVTLSEPLKPSVLPSYSLFPLSLPNEIMAKLYMAELPTNEKTTFENAIKNFIDLGVDNVTIGEYVDQFILGISVNSKYFFGDLYMSEIGQIMKDFVANKTVGDIVYEQRVENKKLEKAKKSIDSFEDAENFLLYLF